MDTYIQHKSSIKLNNFNTVTSVALVALKHSKMVIGAEYVVFLRVFLLTFCFYNHWLKFQNCLNTYLCPVRHPNSDIFYFLSLP